MTAPTKPGQACRVIGSRSNHNDEGPGPNMHKVVRTIYAHDLKAGIEQETVWHCSGNALQTYYGVGPEADFLECWLEVIDDVAAPLKELEHEREHEPTATR